PVHVCQLSRYSCHRAAPLKRAPSSALLVSANLIDCVGRTERVVRTCRTLSLTSISTYCIRFSSTVIEAEGAPLFHSTRKAPPVSMLTQGSTFRWSLIKC